MTVPALATERLRTWRDEDLAPSAAPCADEATGRCLGGSSDPADAWPCVALQVGHWGLRGHGARALAGKKASSQWGGGDCGLRNRHGWPEPEVRCGLPPTARRHGYATEAVPQARAFAYNHLGWTTLTSCIAAENTASRRAAWRLGATWSARSSSTAARLTSTAIRARQRPTHDLRRRAECP